MRLRIVVDMNLSPDWVPVLEDAGHEAIHWSVVGDPRASDATIMAWVAGNDRVVFTHDLDFGYVLALTRARGPSVVQLRTQDVLPDQAATPVLSALQQHEEELRAGALVVVDESASRVRVLPL